MSARSEKQAAKNVEQPPPTAGPPTIKRSRLTLLVWVAVYVLLNTFLIATGPLLGDSPLLVRTFVATAIVVPIIVMWVMPFINRRFAGWLTD